MSNNTAETQGVVRVGETASALRVLAVLYGVILGYALLTFVLGDLIAGLALGTFGALSLIFVVIERLLPAVVAAVAGYCSRKSPLIALFAGSPAPLLAMVVAPTAASQKALGIPVPWLAAHIDLETISPTVWSDVRSRMPLQIAIFVVSFAVGWWRRRPRATSLPSATSRRDA